jgi:hypothetical protein
MLVRPFAYSVDKYCAYGGGISLPHELCGPPTCQHLIECQSAPECSDSVSNFALVAGRGLSVLGAAEAFLILVFVFDLEASSWPEPYLEKFLAARRPVEQLRQRRFITG